MNKYYLQLRGFRIILGAILFFAFVLTASQDVWSQSYTYPQTPKLSLTGTEEGYNADWYPDGRIWLPVTQRGGSPREFLMPVFIDNKWWHYKSTDLAKFLVPDPIYSFRFKVKFDGVAVEPVGLVTVHPFPEDDARSYNVRGDYVEPLAKDFNLQWDVHKDMSYQDFFRDPGDPPIPLNVRERGKELVISGASTKPLPVTDTSSVDYNVLLYVKFRVKLERGSISAEERASEYTPMYISPDTIMYNDWNVREEIAFKNLMFSDSINIQDIYQDPNVPGTYVGMAGMNNKPISSLWNTEPILPGAIYLKLTEKLPRIWYEISRTGSQPPIWDNINRPEQAPEGVWILRDPLTVDSSKVDKPDNVYGQVKFTLRNSTSETRLMDIDIESDAPWLLFMLESVNRSKYVPIGQNTTKGYVNYIDNDILGQGADKPDPMGDLTESDDPVFVYIRCDPDEVIPHNGEKAGIYTGYITIKSKTAEISPVRMRITFVNFRNPFEPDDGSFEDQHRGITLTIRNSRGQTGDETKVIFGTGHRATMGTDTLFGEFAYSGPLQQFGARFYPDDDMVPFGLGDMLPNRVTPMTESRDIRDFNDTLQSHVYLCRFNAGGAENYPVVIEWDTTDFIEGSQLFLSDTLNGSLFPSQNMRDATHLGGSIFSYSIQDPKITSFKIEYTLPRVIEYVDAYGNPKINKGWNLLSLPVRPKNMEHNVVYPNAINIPFAFFNSGYEEHNVLKPGVGYFIRYSDIIDTQFKGTFMNRITKGLDDGFDDEVKVFPGWNTIGALSYPMNIKYIDFEEYSGDKPSRSFVRKHGIWGYRTNEGYYETSVLEPGLGYWLKADEGKHGYLKLIHPTITRVDASGNYEKESVLSSSVELVVRDNAQRTGKLYLTNNETVNTEYFEMPPRPPHNLFDVRFYDNKMLTKQDETIVTLQGVEYPIALNVNNADADYTFVDAITGETLGEIEKGDNGSVEISSTTNNKIKVLKSEIMTGGLGVNVHPNPVMANSTVKYNVPRDGYVKLELVDAVGNPYKLFEGFKSAGEYTYDLSASKFASGRYLCRLMQGSNASTVMITVIK